MISIECLNTVGCYVPASTKLSQKLGNFLKLYSILTGKRVMHVYEMACSKKKYILENIYFYGGKCTDGKCARVGNVPGWYLTYGGKCWDRICPGGIFPVGICITVLHNF